MPVGSVSDQGPFSSAAALFPLKFVDNALKLFGGAGRGRTFWLSSPSERRKMESVSGPT